MLCTLCESIFRGDAYPRMEGDWRDVTWYKHHRSVSEMDEAADLGCRVCAQLLVKFRTVTVPSELSNSSQEPHIEFRLIRHDDYNVGLTLRLAYNHEHEKWDKRWMWSWQEYFLVDTSEMCREENGFSREPMSCTDDLEVWDLIYKWIDDCKGHTECRGSLNTDSEFWHPTRLIDVQNKSTVLNEDVVCVHNTKSIPVQGPYISLSHCWGGVVPLMLTTTNEFELSQGILLSGMPRSFKDAILATRKLGVRYIWIDSLCILQDSKEDWKHEANLMGLVYKHSWLNIATTGANNPHGGLFFERNRKMIQPVLISVHWKDQDEKAHSSNGQALFIDRHLWDDVNDTKLNSRAWVQQERVLSPRQIHFHHVQLFWECRSHTACETFPDGLPRFLADMHVPADWDDNEDDDFYQYCHELKRFTALLDKAHQLDNDSVLEDENEGGKHRRIYSAWCYIVEKYSSCGLTFAYDKLVAISGIAKEMEIATKDQYLVGIWKMQIHNSILWEINAPSGPRSRPLRAPSWTWISTNGDVYMPRPDDPDEEKNTIYIGELLNSSIKYLDNTASGVICEGELRFNCCLYPATIISVEPPPMRGHCKVKVGDEEVEGTANADELEFDEIESKLYYMPVRMNLLDENQNWGLVGLVLLPTGRKIGQFERAGTFVLDLSFDKARAFQNPWPKFEELEYEEVLENGCVVISIV